MSSIHPQPDAGGSAADQPKLRAERDAALEAARAALGDTTRLTRLLTTLSEPGSIEALLDRTVAALSELFTADVVALLTPADVDTCSILAGIGFPEDLLGGPFSSEAGTPLHEALTRGRPVQLLEPAVDARLDELEVHTTLWVPIRDGQAAVIGVVLLGRCAKTPFVTADIALLGSMAHRVGLAVEKAQRSRQVEQLAQAAHRVGRHLQEPLILRQAARILPEVVEAHAATIFLTDSDGRARDFVHSGLTSAETELWAEHNEFLSGAVTRGEKDVHQVADLSEHVQDANARIRSVLAVPISWDGRVQGALLAYRFTTATYNEDVIQLATLFSAHVAAALENARLLQAVRASDDRFRALIRGVSDVIAILSREGRFRYISPAAYNAWQCDPEWLIESLFIERVHPADRGAAGDLLEAARKQPGATVSASLRVQCDVETWRDFEVSVSNQLSDPAVAGIIATYHDVTERKAFEVQLSKLAFRDTLSGLPNRASFMQRLEAAMYRANREERSLAVLFIDLDNFKVINDSLGHAAGDLVLAEVANRLLHCLRADDVAARLGGDEFTILLDDADSLEIASQVAERVRTALSAPIHLPGQDVFVAASIGIALSSSNADKAEDLLRKADLAMYRAKSRGKAQHQVFDVSLDKYAQDRLALETDLRRAIERNELEVHYQPVVSLATEQIRGVEALVRWKHPERGMIAPAHFIPLAEETGLIVDIGAWVLETACRQVQEWNSVRGAPLNLSVNLSARQFQDPGLVARVAAAVERSGLDPRQLVLEITETAVMRDADDAIRKALALRSMHFRLAIDDFGTGYSSLSYLKQFPVSMLKIDRSFVSGLSEDSPDTAIVRTVVALAEGLSLVAIAEGIETQAQAALLRSLGCRLGQGYLFARPLPADVLGDLLRDEAPPALRAA
jgi:diguanylate cyclase (GGDEF)-like protein/PAS domain S-box-containing protein